MRKRGGRVRRKMQTCSCCFLATLSRAQLLCGIGKLDESMTSKRPICSCCSHRTTVALEIGKTGRQMRRKPHLQRLPRYTCPRANVHPTDRYSKPKKPTSSYIGGALDPKLTPRAKLLHSHSGKPYPSCWPYRILARKPTRTKFVNT